MFSARLSRLAASCVTRRADGLHCRLLRRHEASRVKLPALPECSVPWHISSSQWTAQTPSLLALQGSLRASQVLVDRLPPNPDSSRKVGAEWVLQAAALAAAAAGVASSSLQCNSCTSPEDLEFEEDMDDDDEDREEEGPARSKGRSKTLQNEPAARRLRVRSQGNTSMIASKDGWTRDKGNNVMDGCYLTDIDVTAEALMAGFSSPSQYRLARAGIPAVPQELLDAIFPGIEEWVKDLTEKIGTPQADHSAKGFAEALMQVSPASFQDSVINLERNPNHPLYKFDEVFHTPAFVDKYAKDLRDHMQRGQQEILVPRTVQEIVPDVAHGMNGLNDGMSNIHQTSQTQGLDGINSKMDACHQEVRQAFLMAAHSEADHRRRWDAVRAAIPQNAATSSEAI